MPSASKPKPHPITLTLYLLKSDIRAPESALRDPGDPRLHVENVALPGTKIAKLFARQNPTSPPKWTTFFPDSPIIRQRLKTTSAAGVFVFHSGKRFLALTFGHGRHLLAPGSWEDGFGLRVTLNSIDPARLKSIDHKNFESITRHARTQTSVEGTAADFGLNIEQDLVRAVAGTPRDLALGKRMAGMDALVVSVPVELDGLPELARLYLRKYQSDEYKKNFDWIDHIGEVRDAALVRELDEALADRFRRGEHERLWMVPPDLVDWSSLSGFKYRATDEAVCPDLHVSDFVRSVRDPNSITVKSLKSRRILAIAADEEHEIDSWSAYQCIYFEHDRSDETFLLSAGRWYRIARDFAGTVNAEVKRLVSTDPALPALEKTDRDEGEYNARVAKGSGSKYALMDRKNISHGGGPSRVELCDLYSSGGAFIHVKKYAGSAVLSHLFAQGVTSASLWFGDADFRAKANQKLPTTHRLADPAAAPIGKAHRVVYAVASRSKKPIDESLPFFSRLNLRNAAKQLRPLGLRTSLVKVEWR
ncbi:MAG: TIGR04141 family sporadically distributed protein [Myxococcales bacterium]|nr:TIGR04141 family sporadically distributed protein [Myxococcales bacterium]